MVARDEEEDAYETEEEAREKKQKAKDYTMKERKGRRWEEVKAGAPWQHAEAEAV